MVAVKADEGLQEKLNVTSDVDAVVAIANEAGFDVSKADWLKYQSKQTLKLEDEELEGVTGGIAPLYTTPATQGGYCPLYATHIVLRTADDLPVCPPI